jgi:hypothetical protein
MEQVSGIEEETFDEWIDRVGEPTEQEHYCGTKTIRLPVLGILWCPKCRTVTNLHGA